MLRGGYAESARALAREMGIEELVDLDVFVRCHAVEESLRKGSTQECLAWCMEHKHMMKKAKVRNLYFMLFKSFSCGAREGGPFRRRLMDYHLYEWAKLTYFLTINLESP